MHQIRPARRGGCLFCLLLGLRWAGEALAALGRKLLQPVPAEGPPCPARCAPAVAGKAAAWPGATSAGGSCPSASTAGSETGSCRCTVGAACCAAAVCGRGWRRGAVACVSILVGSLARSPAGSVGLLAEHLLPASWRPTAWPAAWPVQRQRRRRGAGHPALQPRSLDRGWTSFLDPVGTMQPL